MNDLTAVAANFHFIRPVWLAALPLIALLLWQLPRNPDRLRQRSTSLQLAPHLRDALTVNRSTRQGLRSVDLIAIGLVFTTLATAGPAWQRIPNPFLAETAPLIVALENTVTMQANDVLPTRLERAKIKLKELMNLRAGGRTALVVFAGTAHLVLPPTEDAQIIKPFLEGLAADIMPVDGQNAAGALELAHDLLRREETPGSILFVSDGLNAADHPVLRDYLNRTDAAGVIMLLMGTEEGGVIQNEDGSFATRQDGTLIATSVDSAEIGRLQDTGVSVIRATANRDDLNRIQRQLASNLRNALDQDDTTAWDDQGWWLLWPAALAFLALFRRGVFTQWLWLFAVGISCAGLSPVSYASPADWFLTSDQQARIAYDNGNFDKAADLFTAPLWKGVAAYRAGRYLEAAELFAQTPTAAGLFNMGNSLIKAQEYHRAVEAYRQAVTQDPGFSAARHNLRVAEHLVSYLEKVREQSDTGDESELGADEFKFDNKLDKGKEIVISDESRLESKSADQWMRAVDTQPRDFLRLKFAQQAERERLP